MKNVPAVERPAGNGVCVLNKENGLVSTPSGATFRIIRLHFSKTGRAKFISHLDLNRTMTRALRRAALPIWYTEGFNKHPYVTFAAPLSLGYEGLAECMDVRLMEDWPMEEVVARLNAAMPEGLAIVDAAPAVKKAGELAAAQYRLTLDCTPEELTAFLAQPTITAEKLTKKKERKTVELTPHLQGLTPTAAGEGTEVTLTLPCSSNDTVNPTLIVQALNAFLGREVRCQVLRLQLLDAAGENFR